MGKKKTSNKKKSDDYDSDNNETPKLDDWLEIMVSYRKRKELVIRNNNNNSNELTLTEPEKPFLSQSDMKAIKLEIQNAFHKDFDYICVRGSYLDILLEAGIPLDPFDPYLHNLDYNIFLGLKCNFIPQTKEDDELDNRRCDNISKGLSTTLRHSKLIYWANKVIETNTEEVSPIPEVNIKSLEFNCSPDLEYQIEQIIKVNCYESGFPNDDVEENCLKTFIEYFVSSNSNGPGLFVLFTKEEDLNRQMNFSVSMLIDKITEITEIYTKTSQNNSKLPLLQKYLSCNPIPMNELIQNAYHSFICGLAKGCQNGCWIFWTLDKSLKLLEEAIKADIRVALIVSALGKEISIIINSHLDELRKTPVDNANAYKIYEIQTTHGNCLNVISAVCSKLLPDGNIDNIENRKIFRTENVRKYPVGSKENKAGLFLIDVGDALIRAIDNNVHNNSIISSFTMCQIFNLYAQVRLQDEVPLFLLQKKHWNIITNNILNPNYNIKNKDYKPYQTVMIKDYDDSVLNIDNNSAIKICATALLSFLCDIGVIVLDANTPITRTVIGPIGKKLLERGLVSLLVKVLNTKDNHIFVLRSAVKSIQSLTRGKDCRSIIFNPTNNNDDNNSFGLNMLIKLLNHHDPIIISNVFLLTTRLLWDKENIKTILTDINNPKLEIIVAKWAIAIIKSIEKKIDSKIEDHFMFNSIQNNAQSLNRKSLNLARENEFWDDYEALTSDLKQYGLVAGYYPINDNDHIQLFLARCLLLLGHLTPFFGIEKDSNSLIDSNQNSSNNSSSSSSSTITLPYSVSDIRSRMNSIKGFELMSYCCDIPGDCMNHSLAGLNKFVMFDCFLPCDLVEPDFFIENLYKVYAGAHPETNAYLYGERIDNQLMTRVVMLIGNLYDNSKNSKNNNEWKPYFNKLEEKYKKESREMYNVFMTDIKNAKNCAQTSPSAQEYVEKIIYNSENNGCNQLLCLKQCSNKSCLKVEEKKNSHKSCGKCNSVQYCSRDCQIVDWKINHKFVCSK